MHFNHKLINDLAWSIGSPSLLDSEECPHPALLGSNWGKKQIITARNLLDNEDKAPQKIQSFLSKSNYFRLGHYFENLVAYWFSIHPDFEILEKNKIIHCTEEGRTLGEIDFIVKNITTDDIIHIEVAVKFYLQVEYHEQNFWFGTNLKDRLDIKLQRLINHQISISDTLDQYTVNKKQILLKGRLFKYSPILSFEHSWLTKSEFIQLNDMKSQWIILQKPFWLAELSDPQSYFLSRDFLSKQQMINHLDSMGLHPVCVAKIDNNCESKRLFITPDNWEQEAIKTLL